MGTPYIDNTSGVSGQRGHLYERWNSGGVYDASQKSWRETTYSQIEASTYRSGVKGRKTYDLATGYLIPTSYTLQRSEADYGTGYIEERYTNGAKNRYTGHKSIGVARSASVIGSSQLPPLPSSMEALAERRALLNLKDQKVNFAQAYAERRQTAQLVSSSLNRMTQSLNALARASLGGRKQAVREAWRILRGLKRSPRNVPQSWLEYQYGWSPLMSDIKGSIDSLQKSDKSRDWVITVKGSKLEKSSGFWDSHPEKPSNTDALDYFTGTKSTRVGVFVRFDVIPDNTFLATVTSLGLTNPALLAWELVPYSFVVDWFLPIGDWLSAMDATLGFKFGFGSKSILREGVVKASFRDGWSTLGNVYRESDYKIYRRDFELKRTVYSSFPFPQFPGFKDPFSADHVANALSLFAGALGGGGRRFNDRYF